MFPPNHWPLKGGPVATPMVLFGCSKSWTHRPPNICVLKKVVIWSISTSHITFLSFELVKTLGVRCISAVVVYLRDTPNESIVCLGYIYSFCLLRLLLVIGIM